MRWRAQATPNRRCGCRCRSPPSASGARCTPADGHRTRFERVACSVQAPRAHDVRRDVASVASFLRTCLLGGVMRDREGAALVTAVFVVGVVESLQKSFLLMRAV